MLTPEPVRRDKEGDWTHTALSKFAGDREYIPSDEWKAWQAKHNIETVIHQMEYDLDENHPAWVRHFDEGHAGSVGWNPEPPSEDWYMLSIHDTEDGPVVIWYREIPEQEGLRL